MQVDFYVLSTTERAAKDAFIARLIEKIYTKGHRIWVRVSDDSLLEHWNRYLWSYRKDSFLPHVRSDEKLDNIPIVLGLDNQLPTLSAVWVNLSNTIPDNVLQAERLVEVICQVPEELSQGRERYRQYQTLGYSIKTHNITKLSHSY